MAGVVGETMVVAIGVGWSTMFVVNQAFSAMWCLDGS